jgi:hypothetical protein
LNETFGQINVTYESQKKREKEINDETLVPLPYKILSNKSKDHIYSQTKPFVFSSLARVEIYENCCQTLDITSDWQIRGLLPYDNIVLSDRSFSFNNFRAFATAIEENLESLTLHCVGLTSRSISVLCQGLKKCIHLNLLVK